MLAKTLLAGAFAVFAAAQSTVVSFTDVPAPFTVGTASTIKYTASDLSSPVTIILRKGAATNLQTVATLTDSATGGEYVWTPSSSLESDTDYALEIVQGSEINYSALFTILGGSSSSSASPPSYGSSSTSTPSASAPGYASSSVIVPYSSTSIPSYNATLTAQPSLGTGIPATRNTTMVSPTLTNSFSTGAVPSTTGSGAGFQTSTPAESTGAAASLSAGSSVVALLFGAVAAVFFC